MRFKGARRKTVGPPPISWRPGSTPATRTCRRTRRCVLPFSLS
jgi:hypothetical protein